MSSSGKKKKYHFSIQTIIRLIIFSVLLFFLITYLSQNQNTNQTIDASVLGDQISSSSPIPKINLNEIYNKIPPQSRNQIENLNQNQAVIYLQEKYQELIKLSNGFPQKQIKEVKKILLKSAYEDILKNIDKP